MTVAATNKIQELLADPTKKKLSIYFTAGFPKLDDTVSILQELQSNGVDMVEIGMPFSDPLADGPVIQKSSEKALDNGMTLKLLFEQLKDIRTTVNIPLVLMGYLNTVMQYGVEAFCQKAGEIGIDGVILPDLPLHEYEQEYQTLFKENNLAAIFLITPQTSEQRIRKIDELSNGFIYMVSSSSTTGNKLDSDGGLGKYAQRIQDMNLRHPVVTGFGISSKATFEKATQFTNGGIIGSAFINAITESTDLSQDIKRFIDSIKAD